MGVTDMRMTVIECDGCPNPFEDEWGTTYFEFEDHAIAKAKEEGWEIGDELYADAFCPDCLAKRKRAEEGKPELPEEIPGQLDLLAEVAR